MGRLRLLTAGESHGAKVVALLEGIPAGLRVSVEKVDLDLSRRQRGYGRGQRMKSIERDHASFTAGVRHGETFGAPVLVEIDNLDHAKWRETMSPLPLVMPDPNARTLTRPRPGHADLAGGLKYARTDLRDVLERASARSTASRVAAGSIAKQLIAELGIEIFGFVTGIGRASWEVPETADWKALWALAERSDVGCPDEACAAQMRAEIDAARAAGDTVGGTFIVIATGVPTGLGSYADWDRKLDGRLAQAVMSIPAVKSVEIGLGMECARRRGSEVHDVISFDSARRHAGSGGFVRETNRAGGLEAGVTNGADVVVRGAMKPISTLARPLGSIDFASKEPVEAGYERSDICAVPACTVIAEAAIAIVLADAALESYGGDTVRDLKAHHQAVVERFAST